MARVETASASVSTDSIKGLAQSIAKPAYRRLLTAEPALRRAVPALIIAFLVTICIGAFVQVFDHRRQAIAEVVRGMTGSAEFLADRLGRSSAPTDGRKQTELEQIIPAWALVPGRQIILTNADGIIVAAVRVGILTGDGMTTAVAAARQGRARPPAHRRARAIATTRYSGGRGRRAGDRPRRRHAGLRDGALARLRARPGRGRAPARRCAGGLALRHRADRHALGHHRLRGADPRLRLPLAGDARPRGRRHLRDRAHPHRHRAQPRPLRAVGLGPRAAAASSGRIRCSRSWGSSRRTSC